MEGTPSHKDRPGNEGGVTRRGFIVGGAAALAAGAAGYYLYDKFRDKETYDLDEGELFSAEQSEFSAALQLSSNQLQYFDEHKRPVGQPIDFSKAIPESLRPYGVAISPPPQRWRQEMARKLEANPENQGRKIVKSHNVALEFKSALERKGEKDLVDGIKSGQIKTVLDIANHYGNKTVRGVSEEISRKEYVSKEFSLPGSVPKIVHDEIEHELKTIMPGLCANESRFNNNLVSGKGARGIFQFMPDTWKGFDRTEADFDSLKIQTEVAGLHMAEIYKQLMHHCDDEALLRVRDLYPSKSDFLRHFIVPMMVNSYNAGSKRLAFAANKFFTPKRNLEGLTGKDVFLTMADFAKESKEGILEDYGDDAREYYSRATAFSRLL